MPWFARLCGLWDKRPVYVALALALGVRLLWFAFAHWGTGDMLDPHIVFSPLMDLDVWTRWDGTFYVTIARDGYLGTKSGDVAFFPLYPLTIAGVAAVTSLPFHVAALVVSHVCDVIAWVSFALLARARLGGGAASLVALLAFVLFPTRNFEFSAYSEGMFLCVSVGAFLAYERRRFAGAALLAACASAVRPQGVLVGMALLGDAWWRRWRRESDAPSVREGGVLFASFAGLTAYVAFLALRFGQPFYFLAIQSQWHRRLTNPLLVFFAGGEPLAYLALVIAIVVCVAMFRTPASPLRDRLYAASSILLPMTSGSMLSMARFMGVIFPLFIFAGGQNLPRPVRIAYVTCALFYVASIAYRVGQGDVVL